MNSVLIGSLPTF